MSNLSGKNYMDMSEEYRNSTSKDDFRSARKEENKRMAGEALDPKVINLGKAQDPYRAEDDPNVYVGDIKRGDDPIMKILPYPENGVGGRTRSDLGDAPQVEDINNYDTTAFGKGSGAGGDRLSRRDLQALKEQGFSTQDIIDYSKEKVAGGTKQGAKAQKLLNKWTSNLDIEVPADPVDPGDPDLPVDPSDPTTPPPSVQPTPDPIDPTPLPIPNPEPPIRPEDPWDQDPFVPTPPVGGGTPPNNSQNQNVNTSQQVSQGIFQTVNNTNNVDNSVEMNNNSSNVINGNNNQIDNSMTNVGGNTTISNVTDLNANNRNSQEVNATQYGGGIWR